MKSRYKLGEKVILHNLNVLQPYWDESSNQYNIPYETENANGSWYCSAYKAKEDIREYLDEFFEFQEWYRKNFGVPIIFESDAEDYHNSPECVHCSWFIFAVEAVFNSAFDKAYGNTDIWNKKIEITQDFIDKVIEGLEEVDSIW